MKALIAVLVLAVGIALVFAWYDKDKPAHPEAVVDLNAPIWQQPLPEGTEPVPTEQVKLSIRAERRDDGKRHSLVFHISEEHGYLVDGIRVYFWFRFKDDDTGEWIEDANRIEHFIRDRLEFNATLVSATPLRDLDFPGLGVDLAATTTENWGVEIANFERAARKAE